MFADGPVAFDGDEQAYARPMKPVLDGLEQLGACIEYHGEEGRLPFTITPPQTVSQCAEPSVVSIDSSGSSQFISGLLLIGSRVSGGLELHHTGEKTPSLPHIRMTVADLHGSGVRVNADEHARVWTVQPGAVQLPETVTVECRPVPWRSAHRRRNRARTSLAGIHYATRRHASGIFGTYGSRDQLPGD